MLFFRIYYFYTVFLARLSINCWPSLYRHIHVMRVHHILYYISYIILSYLILQMDLFFNHPGKLMLALFIEAFRKNDNQGVTIRSMLHLR